MNGTKKTARKARRVAPMHFDGFPYIVTRIVSGLYHIILLPARLTLGEMLEIARRQAAANALETCLVLGEGRCAYIRREGDAAWSAFVPESSIWISDRLLPCVDFGEDGELLERRARLEDYIEARKRNGFLGGDWTKGGRPATPEELQSLAGEAAPGVPKGLVFCEVCGGWRGVCLDPNPIFKNKVMTVLCRCENDNLCARCGQPLDTYKLNANYFGEDGLIWHTPGFCGLNHRCHDLPPVN